jgi:hypothetical protein
VTWPTTEHSKISSWPGTIEPKVELWPSQDVKKEDKKAVEVLPTHASNKDAPKEEKVLS